MIFVSTSIGLLATVPWMLRDPKSATFLFVVVVYSNLAFIMANLHDVRLVNDLSIAACLALLACYRLLYLDSHRGSWSFFAAGALWLGAVLLSLIFSPAAEASADLLAIVPELLLAYGLFLLVSDLDRLRWALYGVACTTVALSALTVIQAAFGLQDEHFLGFAQGRIQQISLGSEDDWRPTGPIGDPNFYAQLLLPGLAVCIDRALHGARWMTRSVASAGVALISVALVLTASRGALLAFVVMVALFLLRHRRLLLVLPIIAVLSAVLALPTLGNRIDSVVTALSSMGEGTAGHVDPAVVGRVNELLAAQHMFVEYPWTGVGYGQFEQHYQAISARYDLLMRPADRGAHSLYLETLAEQGLVGIAVLGIILALTARAIARALALLAGEDESTRHVVAALGVGLVGFFLAALFLHDAYPRYQWIMLALAFAAEKTSARRHERTLKPLGAVHARAKP